MNGLIETFSPDPQSPVGIAVSGGSDSLALLYALSDWADQSGRRLLVLTVDHGLRPEAAREAEQVGEVSQALGHAHQTLTWRTPRPGQNAARRARLCLLGQALRKHGACTLMLGHTQDDVFETVLIRRARQIRGWSSVGPTSIAPMPVWPAGRQIALIRPLITTRRAELRAWLKSRNISWIEDPSNQQTRFERVRVRQRLQQHEDRFDRLRPYIRDLQIRRQAEDQRLARALKETVEIDSTGLIRLLKWPVSGRLLGCLVRYAGGHDRVPRQQALARLTDQLQRPGQRYALGGAWFQKTRNGALIGRDPGAVMPCLEDGLWDGRYQQAQHDQLPHQAAMPYLLRAGRPEGDGWQEILSDRLDFAARTYAARWI